jgi:A/G-specific adenine glycosylase
VILQQTRVEQAIPLYERFLARFPDVRALAQASEEEVLKVWEGAGYYARARNLRLAARDLAGNGTVVWPTTVEGWERLPGVGPYIARAVASLAFDRPVVALEANGRRVGARWSLETGDVRSPAVARRLERHLASALPEGRAGIFNEAIMELGETVCLPKRPLCRACPIAPSCRAFRELSDPGALPRRRATRSRPHVVAAIALAERNGRFLVLRRPSVGLLGGLWELPGGKVEPGESPREAARREFREETGLRLDRVAPVGVVRHSYSHFTVELHLYAARAPGKRRAVGEGTTARWVTAFQFGSLPRPRATVKAVELWRRWLRRPLGRASPGSGSRPGRRRT